MNKRGNTFSRSEPLAPNDINILEIAGMPQL
jgi:hypothetical protein